MTTFSCLIGGILVVVLGLLSLSSLAYAVSEQYPILLEDSLIFTDGIYATEFYDEFGYFDFKFINPVNYENMTIISSDFQYNAQLKQENNELKQEISKLKQQVNFLEDKISLMTNMLFQYTNSLENLFQY